MNPTSPNPFKEHKKYLSEFIKIGKNSGAQVITLLIVVGILIIVNQSSTLSPFIYAIF